MPSEVPAGIQAGSRRHGYNGVKGPLKASPAEPIFLKGGNRMTLSTIGLVPERHDPLFRHFENNPPAVRVESGMTVTTWRSIP
jgi:hypothetical protein